MRQFHNIHFLITITLPLYLIIFQVILRLLFEVEIGIFIGPTLAGAGISFLIPVIKPRKFHKDLEIEKNQSSLLNLAQKSVDILNNQGFDIMILNQAENYITAFVALLINLLIWVITCGLAIKATGIDSYHISAILVGGVGYIIGILIFKKHNN